jgi:hypothetical protein
MMNEVVRSGSCRECGRVSVRRYDLADAVAGDLRQVAEAAVSLALRDRAGCAGARHLTTGY